MINVGFSACCLKCQTSTRNICSMGLEYHFSILSHYQKSDNFDVVQA